MRKSHSVPWIALLFAAFGCAEGGVSSEHTPEVSDETALYPLLPNECSEQDAAFAIDIAEPNDALQMRLRASDDSLYYLNGQGVWVLPFQNPTPTLVLASPNGVTFQDFWLEDGGVVAVENATIFRATAGTASVAVARVPAFAEPQAAKWFYAQTSASLYSVAVEFTPPSTVYSTPLVLPASLSRVPISLMSVTPQLVATPRRLYLADSASTAFDSNYRGALWVVRDDAQPPVQLLVKEEVEGLVGAMDNAYVVVRKGEGFGLISVSEEAPSSGKPLTLPLGVDCSSVKSGNPLWVEHEGAGYFLCRRSYRLPKDRRLAIRTVLMRIQPTTNEITQLRCVAPRFDAMLPEGDQGRDYAALAVSRAGIFALSMPTQRLGSGDWEAEVFRVWPPRTEL
jgi:hypothetical protein